MAPTKKKTQPSPKRTRSSPNPQAIKIVKAIRKTQSLNKVTPSCSSPVSVKKKAISENLKKKLSKKKKQVDSKKKNIVKKRQKD